MTLNDDQYHCLAQYTLGLTDSDRDLRLSQVDSPPHRHPFHDLSTIPGCTC